MYIYSVEKRVDIEELQLGLVKNSTAIECFFNGSTVLIYLVFYAYESSVPCSAMIPALNVLTIRLASFLICDGISVISFVIASPG